MSKNSYCDEHLKVDCLNCKVIRLQDERDALQRQVDRLVSGDTIESDHLTSTDDYIIELLAERLEATTVLDPNIAESGLVDACRQVKQAAISGDDNYERIADLLRKVRPVLQVNYHKGQDAGYLIELLTDIHQAIDSGDCGENQPCVVCGASVGTVSERGFNRCNKCGYPGQ